METNKEVAPAGRGDGHHRRSDYVPTVMAEMFMVPLLRGLIDSALTKYAVRTSSIKDQCALDIGCGEQPFRGRLEEMGFKYCGLDVQQNSRGTVDVIAPIDRPAPSALLDWAPFDFILCTEVLEHVADWSIAFENFQALLSPEGKIVITCPAFYPLHEEPHDYWRPTKYALAYYARRVGLRIVEQQAAGSGWDVLGTMLGGVRILPRGRGWWHRLARVAVAIIRKSLVAFLRLGLLQRLTDTGGSIYLSNMIVLERA